MGAASSSTDVGHRIDTLGESGVYKDVSRAVKRCDLSGGFLLQADAQELEDFLVSRCPDLGEVERHRLLFELDCMKRRELADKACSSSEGKASSSSSLLSDEDNSNQHKTNLRIKERWRDTGSKHVGSSVERLVWDEKGTFRVRARGRITAWCCAEDSTFLDANGRKAPLWRARFDNLDDLVELEEHEVIEAVAQHEASLTEDAVRLVETSTKRRQRLGDKKPLPAIQKKRHEVVVVQGRSCPQVQTVSPQAADPLPKESKKRGRPRKSAVNPTPPPVRIISGQTTTTRHLLPDQISPRPRVTVVNKPLDWRKKPRLEMLTASEAYDEDDGAPPTQGGEEEEDASSSSSSGVVVAAPTSTAVTVVGSKRKAASSAGCVVPRTRRGAAGRKNCRGCHQYPCAKSCIFTLVDSTKLDEALAAGLGRRDSARPDDVIDEGSEIVDVDGRKWYVCRDEDTLADVCASRNLDVDTLLAVNERSPQFKVGHKLTPKSKLKRYTRLLLSL